VKSVREEGKGWLEVVGSSAKWPVEGEAKREAKENAGVREYTTCKGALASLREGGSREFERSPCNDKWALGVVICVVGANVGKGGKPREELTLTDLEKIQLRAMRLKQLRVLLIAAIVASEQTVFAIEGTPKNGGQAFLFKGRAQVAYVR